LSGSTPNIGIPSVRGDSLLWHFRSVLLQLANDRRFLMSVSSSVFVAAAVTFGAGWLLKSRQIELSPIASVRLELVREAIVDKGSQVKDGFVEQHSGNAKDIPKNHKLTPLSHIQTILQSQKGQYKLFVVGYATRLMSACKTSGTNQSSILLVPTATGYTAVDTSMDSQLCAQATAADASSSSKLFALATLAISEKPYRDTTSRRVLVEFTPPQLTDKTDAKWYDELSGGIENK
jgi:hypothetical protein